jgi:hypothetical protein
MDDEPTCAECEEPESECLCLCADCGEKKFECECDTDADFVDDEEQSMDAETLAKELWSASMGFPGAVGDGCWTEAAVSTRKRWLAVARRALELLAPKETTKDAPE